MRRLAAEARRYDANGYRVIATNAIKDQIKSMIRNELTVEGNVNVDDIHAVHSGMRAEVHFNAFKQRVLPVIHGEVIQVSADRLTDPKTNVPYYTALVRVDERELADAKDVELQPGMSATVMIPTKERTALDYLLGPIVTSFDHAFRQK